MQVQLWSDYLCPWCYLGRDRTSLIRSLGVDVVHRAYELHPEIPPEGRPVRPDGRLAEVHRRIGDECTSVGLAFNPPTQVPNTRRALAMAELVRIEQPDVFAVLDDGLFSAYFVDDRDLGDHDVLRSVAARAGVDPERVERALAGEADQLLRTSVEEALEAGVAGTPAWVFPGGVQLPGVQDRRTVEIWVTRLKARAAG